MLGTRFRRSEKVLAREIAGECLLVPCAESDGVTGEIFCLSPTAMFVWQRLTGQHTVQRILDEVVAEYDVAAGEARQDVIELLTKMQGMGLVEASDDHGGHDGVS